MLSEVMAVLQPQRGEKYLDLTAGYAGHANEILAVTQNYKNAILVDRDDYAMEFLKTKYLLGEVFNDAATALTAEAGPKLLNKDFYNAVLQLIECGQTFVYDIGGFWSVISATRPSRSRFFIYEAGAA